MAAGMQAIKSNPQGKAKDVRLECWAGMEMGDRKCLVIL
jgi:hypothetical protein